MNSKRSYLDTLNAGRQRRPQTTLEQLNRSLETLQQRLEQSRGERSGGSDRFRPAEPRYPQTAPYGQPSGEFSARRAPEQPQAQQPFRQSAYGHVPGAAAGGRTQQNYESLARDIDRVRGQEDGVVAVGRIAEELRSLRDELREQMSAGLHSEFDALRENIDRAFRAGPAAKGSAELGVEFERLSGAIQALAERSDDRNVNMLRLDLEQMKAALDTLAREESVQKADRRWDDFYHRWNAFEDRLDADARKRADGPGLSILFDRLEQIGNAVNNLPESLSLQSLEEKVRALAGAVDHFANQQGSRSGETFGMIDERLDEISRAIVASTVAAQSNAFDPAAFERIEQRIAALAGQIEEVAGDRPGGELIERLNQVSSRVDDLAARAHLPEQAIDRLGQQIALIAEKVDRAPRALDAEEIFHGIEQRFDVLAGMIERRQGDAVEHGNMLFRDLERRLDEVADRLDRRPEPSLDSAGIMEAIDARFTAMAKRLETRQPDAAGQAAMRGLESRLEDISNRLDSSAAQVAGIDPDLIRSLEAQVAGLSAHLSKPGTPLPDFEDIGPRIARIEQAVAGSRDTILEAARQAAENAVRTLGSASPDTPAVAGLAQDLKTLDTLTRRSDERNAKTFEAIHDTLLKIVDRLGSLEGGPDEPALAPAVPGKIAVRETPTLDMGEALPLAPVGVLEEDAGDPSGPLVDAPVARTPAQAAAAAAKAALGDETVAEKPAGRRKSMLGGLARAFSRKDAETAAVEPAVEAPEVGLDEPLEPKLANRPLEPGSGAPDLSAIMKRVRDERAQPAKAGEGDAAKSDFIAAARRAAQAAAAEADALKRQSTISGPVKALRIGDLLKARRKPILMAAAAIMLALAGLQLGKAFLSDQKQVAAVEPAPVVDRKPVQAAAVDVAPKVDKSETVAAAPAEKASPSPPVRIVGQDDAKAEDAMAARDLAAAPVAVEPAPPADATDAEATDMALPAAPVGPLAPAAAVAPAQPAQETTGTVTPSLPVTSEPPAAVADIPSEIGPAALREAAAKGDAKALFEIGSRYAEGRGVKEDTAAAAKWYEKAAEGGLAVAEYRIGNFYEKGIGVARDIQKSKTWYQLAAEQGNASAMHNLAVLFAMAADGVTDNKSAAEWFQKAADLGVKDSQFNLGILAAKGVGMPQNLEESYKWFALVAKTGDKDAAAKRDEIANALRPEQLEHARASVELWKPKPLDQAANGVELPDAWQDAPTTTASVDMKKAVQNIQRILNKNGYDTGGADGIMGGRTKNAIMAFQSDNGMKATGEVDETLVKALLARK
jgi:localization factor PodJL